MVHALQLLRRTRIVAFVRDNRVTLNLIICRKGQPGRIMARKDATIHLWDGSTSRFVSQRSPSLVDGGCASSELLARMNGFCVDRQVFMLAQ
jgi:hypothetical protein